MLKTQFVASKDVRANNPLLSSERLIGDENEEVCICLFILNSRLSCGFIFFVQSIYQYVFYLGITILYSFKYSKSFCCYKKIKEFFNNSRQLFVLFLGSELFFITLGLLSVFWTFSFCGIYFTLLSEGNFWNVIYFKENINIFVSFDNIIS